MNILITGASGLIGTHLTQLLLEKNYAAGHLVRDKISSKEVKHFQWDPLAGKIDPEAIRWADAIINLSGAGIADKRWTKSRKELVIRSRVEPIRLLAREARKQGKNIRAFVTASGSGYYGRSTDEHLYVETDPPGSDFPSLCCREWENAADLFEEFGSRVVKLRIGVVLARDGGALPKLAAPVKWYAGAPLGNGGQIISWVHIDDVCRAFLFAVENDTMQGAYNTIAGNEPNRDFVRSIGKVLNKPVFLPPVPAFAMRLLMGEMAMLVTEGSRLSNLKLKLAGFEFEYEKLLPALEKELCARVPLR